MFQEPFFLHIIFVRGITLKSRLPLVLPLVVRRVCVLGTRDQLKEL